MYPSLLHRLPDIVALARQRAQELDPRIHTSHSRSSEDRVNPPEDAKLQRVSLLCGDELSVIRGLIMGLSSDGPLAGRLPLIRLLEDPRDPAGSEGAALTTVQRETRRLVDLTTRLFLVRALLRNGGWLAATVFERSDRCVEHLLGAVFGHAHPLPSCPTTEWRCYLARHLGGPAASAFDLVQDLASGPALLHDLTLRLTLPGDPVLVLQTDIASVIHVAALNRHWIFSQHDAPTVALLREQVIARQMDTGAVLRAEESGYDWSDLP